MPVAGGSRPQNEEDEEFELADAILDELRRKAAIGDGDLVWGDVLERCCAADGKLYVTREYTASLEPGAPALRLRELPYSAHPDTDLGVNGTGGVVWAGALGLVELLRERAANLLRTPAPPGACPSAPMEGPSPLLCLEIGAGCGLPGLCAAALADAGERIGSGARVVLTDENDAVLDNLRHNVESNRAALGSSSVEVARLEWTELLDGLADAPAEAVDLLLGSDVIWGERGGLVGRVARRLVREGGTLVISAQEGREGLDVFEAALRCPEGDGPGQGQGSAFDVEVSRRVAGEEKLVLYVCQRRIQS